MMGLGDVLFTYSIIVIVIVVIVVFIVIVIVIVELSNRQGSANTSRWF